ncbi:hypothetical protein YC2023_099259 [Brassica napus]
MIKDKIELQGRSTLDNRESYARRLSSLCIGFSLKSIADETRELEVHQSNGKKLESKIVTLSRLQLPQEGNVNKRIKEAARAINFSSTDKVLPVDALIIGALKYMELVASSSNEADRKESRMDYDDQFDDLHGQELMDIEEGVTISEPVVDPETLLDLGLIPDYNPVELVSRRGETLVYCRLANLSIRSLKPVWKRIVRTL